MSKKFPWGKVTQVHDVGTHQITEYVVGPNWSDAGKTMFQTDNASWPTLEWALLDCICRSASPDDYHMTEYAGRLIGLKSE